MTLTEAKTNAQDLANMSASPLNRLLSQTEGPSSQCLYGGNTYQLVSSFVLHLTSLFLPGLWLPENKLSWRSTVDLSIDRTIYFVLFPALPMIWCLTLCVTVAL